MERLRKQVVAIVSLLLPMALPKLAQGQLGPACLSQFAVVNQACALLPIGDGPEEVHAFSEEQQVARSSPERLSEHDGGQGHHEHEGAEGHHGQGQGHNGSKRGHGHDGGERHQGHGHDGEHHHGHGHEGGERHGQEWDESHDGRQHGHGHEGGERHEHGHDGRGEHHHGYGHGHGHEHHRRVDERCCRWLRETDERCVCTALLALPRFLINPDHAYTLQVGSVCKVTFNCHGMFG